MHVIFLVRTGNEISGDRPDLPARECRIDESGGTVGRDAGCTLVLPDARNIVSGRHMAVRYADGRFVITDTSRNGVFVNGARVPVGLNNTHVLADGDLLRIGEYELQARIEGVAAPAPWGAPGGAPAGAGDMAVFGRLIDPEPKGAADVDPLAYLGPAAPSIPPAAVRPFQSPVARPGVDDDLSDLFQDMPGTPDTDALLGPGRAGPVVNPFAPPPPLSPAPVSPPSLPPAAPLPVPPGPPQPIMLPPEAVPPLLVVPVAVPVVPAAPVPAASIPVMAVPVAPLIPQAPPPPAPSPPPAPAGAALIPDDWMPNLGGIAAPPPAPAPAPVPAAPPPPAALPPEPPVLDTAMLLQRREAARDAARSPAPAPPPARGEEAELLGLLWQALGVDPARVSPADKRRFMGELGVAVREMADGLISVLAMRQSMKSEFQIDRTQIGATENNLFKFTRNADELLGLVLASPSRAFLPLDRGVKDAFHDIRSHQVATLYAVQLAIRSLLDRFDPAKIEDRASQRRGMFTMGSGKAANWDYFANAYQELAGDADEAASRIFATEFARAYREQSLKAGDD